MGKQEYIEKNRAWLEDKAREEGVEHIAKGICRRVLHSGKGPAFRLRDLIPGWIIALQQMHVGDKWEIYIPAEQGYGSRSVPGIPGGSTLVFEIELLGVS